GSSSAVGKSFNGFDYSLQASISEQMPYTPAAGNGEQPQLSVTDLAAQELQHRRWVCTRQPLRLGHGLSFSRKDVIHHATTLPMLARLPAVEKQLLAHAPGIFQGIGEDRQAVKCLLVPNRTRDG